MFRINQELFLLRHCATTGQGAEAALTELGAQQAEKVAAHLATLNITGIRTSDYRRSLESVRPLRTLCGLPETIDPDLGELRLGRVQGDWRIAFSFVLANPTIALPEGEPPASALERMSRGVAAAVREQGERPLVVSHGAVMALLFESISGKPAFEVWREIQTPDLYRIVCDANGVTIQRLELPL